MRPRSSRNRQTRLNRPSLISGSTASPRKHRPDYILALLVLLLAIVGLVLIYSIGPALAAVHNVSGNYYIEKQFIAVGLAIIAFIVASKIPFSTWRRYAKPLLMLAALATLVAIVLPVNPNYPAHRWVRLGGLSFQSIEIVKLALLVWIASLLAKNSVHEKINNFSKTFKPLVIVLLIVGLVVALLQKDLGSTGVIIAMMFGMAYVAGVSFKKIGIFVAAIGVVGIIAIAIEPYRIARLDSFLHPEQNCQTADGYQACQAMISVGSGGMFGLGVGRSVQAYGYMPEATNDSIFAIYAEKFGFVGSILLLALFVGFFYRMRLIAERAPDEFSRFLVVGVLSWMAMETLINIGGMIGVMPMKGITLPFISYGGTSMVFSAAAVGLVFQVSKYTAFSSPRITSNKEARVGNNNDRRRLGRPYYASTSGRR